MPGFNDGSRRRQASHLRLNRDQQHATLVRQAKLAMMTTDAKIFADEIIRSTRTNPLVRFALRVPELPRVFKNLQPSWKTVGSAFGAVFNVLFKGPDISRTLYHDLAPAFPDEIKVLFSTNRIVLAEIEDENPRIYVKCCNDGSFALVVHQGLYKFLYRVARAFSTFFVEFSTNDERALEKNYKGARIIAEIFWWYKNTKTAWGPSYETTRENLFFAYPLVHAAESFFLCHEIGHIIIKNNGNAFSRHEEESRADFIAASMMKELPSLKSDKFKEMSEEYVVLGQEMALLTFSSLEKLGVNFGTAHPPFNVRLNAIRSVYSGKFQGTIAKVEAIFQEIMRQIEEPSPEEKEWVNGAEQCIRETFISLLDACVARNVEGTPLDETGFGFTMSELLNEGFAYIIFHEIKLIARNGGRAQAKTTVNSLLNLSQSELQFLRVRILVHYFSLQPAPLSTYFRALFVH
ncbi:MAG: hypothetical protein KIS97_13470 [Nitrospira sp.]|nr:hypothetical protein [Nitrospira sp.]